MSGLRQREPRRLDPAYLRWVRKLPCVACAVNGRAIYGCEAAHVKIAVAEHGWRGHGLSERSHDDRAVGLCSYCHRTGRQAQHAMGERKFWLALGICPGCLCEALVSAYEAGQSGLEVIWSAVRAARERPTDHL